MPSRARSPCTPCAGALRGAPASITTTDRRARASIRAPLNPAAPPPITTTSTSSSHASIATTSTTTMRRHGVRQQTLLRIWQHAGMDDDLDRAIGAAGPRLRALRRQRDTTLDELSAQTGISKSTLSRLESGSRRPTLELLLPLARIYGVTLDELVDAPPTGDPRVHLRPVTRGGMTMLPLTRRAGGAQAFKIIMHAGS